MEILLVDDNTLLHGILTGGLTGSGANVRFCADLASAREATADTAFAFVCVALHLPDGDGIALARNLRAQPGYRHTPIVLLTSSESTETYREAISSGVTDVFLRRDVGQLVEFMKRFTLLRAPLQGRVLYVEDTRSQRELLTHMLSGNGLEVRAFANAESAWEQYADTPFDLVISDLVLSGQMSGIEFINRIRRLEGASGDVPILAVTAFDDISRRIELFYLGVTDYVIKPVIEEELLARVGNLIARQRLYRTALTAQEQARTANETKSNFISHVAHELRTPLNAIQGYAQMLAANKEQPLSATQTEQVQQIRQAGDHVLALVADLLDTARIEAGKVELQLNPISIQLLTSEAIKQVSIQAQNRGIEIMVPSVDPALSVRADPRRTLQVLLNLLSNAVKYNREGGTIQLLCEAHEDSVQVSVQDTGEGLSAEQLEQLFVPFKRLARHQNIEGTGLGLVVCRSLMEAMNGSIAVTSEVGVGTRFTITLPRAA